jgi:ABC-type multidrug transport system fused ATPase/permease subunit
VALYERVLHQPFSWHVARNSSEVIAVVQKAQIVTGSILMPLMYAVTAALIGVAIVAALLWIDPLTSLVAFAGFGLLYVGVSRLARRTLAANSAALARAETERVQAVQEGMGGIRDVLLDASQPVFVTRFETRDREFQEAMATSGFIAAAPRFVMEGAGMVLISGLAFVLAAGDGGLPAAVPVLGALALGTQRLLPLMNQIYVGWTNASAYAQLLRDVLGILEEPVPVRAQPALAAPVPFEREIAFRDVSFAYPTGKGPVLRNLDLVITKGARVGIIGKTGAGKSTLVDLLMGLLEPTAGIIEIDGRRLDHATRRAWQRQVAHVPLVVGLGPSRLRSVHHSLLPWLP